MRRIFLIDSPLEKGGKGGCEPEVGALSSSTGREKIRNNPLRPLF